MQKAYKYITKVKNIHDCILSKHAWNVGIKMQVKELTRGKVLSYRWVLNNMNWFKRWGVDLLALSDKKLQRM